MNVKDGAARGHVVIGADIFFSPGPEPIKPQAFKDVLINQRLHIRCFTSSEGFSVFLTSEFLPQTDALGLPD